MIYTLTLNPALDYTLYSDSVICRGINTSERQQILCGGKGINVSRALKNLGIESTALGFVGGFSGRELEKMLQSSGIKTDFVTLESGITRINIKLRDGAETDINCDGPYISEKDIEALINKLNCLKSGDVLCLSGSVPKSLGDDIYAEIMNRLKGKNIRFTLDTSGRPLMKALKLNPMLVKPNIHELGDLFGQKISKISDVSKYAKKLLEAGAENVLVSMGKNGALFLGKNIALRSFAPQGTAVDTVASGDSMVAGFIAEFLRSGNIKSALTLATAFGSATAFSSGIGQKSLVESLAKRVKIKNISV